MPDICVLIGRRTRALRKKCGFTQEELAKRAEITRESLSRMENGREAGIYTMARLAKALGVTLSHFFEGI
jgi:transcriptional regulator with XRE-family HTH domain